MKIIYNRNISNGFGLIEVLISALIIIIVTGAIVSLVRGMTKKNIQVSEKIQAYNLLREGLELGRVYRDTVWIDKLTDEWDLYFSEEDFYLHIVESGSIELVTGVEEIIYDNIKYSRKYLIKSVDEMFLESINEHINSEDDPNYYNVQEDVLVLEIEVEWKNGKVSAATLITNWKPQI